MDMQQKYLLNTFRMDDEPEEPKEEKPQPDTMMLMKKMEKYFFDTRSVYLWGGVDDRSAKDVVNNYSKTTPNPSTGGE